MTADRVADVTLALHELAANAVRHGGGRGRLRLQVIDSELFCQLTDPGPPGGRTHGDGSTAERSAVGKQPGRFPWPLQPGHGLWLVRRSPITSARPPARMAHRSPPLSA
jgi:two-component sensor histidine kinase